MILLDTSGLLSALDGSEELHERSAAALAGASSPRVISPFVLAELDYLLGRRVGRSAQLALLREMGRGAYVLASFSEGDIELACEVLDRYGDLDIGLADASIVVLASRYETDLVLTLDRRHFEALRTLEGKRFRLLPEAI